MSVAVLVAASRFPGQRQQPADTYRYIYHTDRIPVDVVRLAESSVKALLGLSSPFAPSLTRR
jgi:hypothetical protein